MPKAIVIHSLTQVEIDGEPAGSLIEVAAKKAVPAADLQKAAEAFIESRLSLHSQVQDMAHAKEVERLNQRIAGLNDRAEECEKLRAELTAATERAAAFEKQAHEAAKPERQRQREALEAQREALEAQLAELKKEDESAAPPKGKRAAKG